jgi:hypothetical protein
MSTDDTEPFAWTLVRKRSVYVLVADLEDAGVSEFFTTSKPSRLEREARGYLSNDDLDMLKSSLFSALDGAFRIEVYHQGLEAMEVPLAPRIRCSLDGEPMRHLLEVSEEELEEAAAIEVSLDWDPVERTLGTLPEPTLQHGELCFVEPQAYLTAEQIDEWMTRGNDPDAISEILITPPGELLAYGASHYEAHNPPTSTPAHRTTDPLRFSPASDVPIRRLPIRHLSARTTQRHRVYLGDSTDRASTRWSTRSSFDTHHDELRRSRSSLVVPVRTLSTRISDRCEEVLTKIPRVHVHSRVTFRTHRLATGTWAAVA